MQILLDADTFLGYLLHRSNSIDEIENLHRIIQSSSIVIHISKIGLDRINNLIKAKSGKRAAREMAGIIRKSWKIRILRTSQSVIQEAMELPLCDLESSIEVVLAKRARISAIVTHKLDDFSEMGLNVMTLQDFKCREVLEASLSKATRERPAVLSIPQKVAILDELYSLPSYTSNTASKSEIRQSSEEDFVKANNAMLKKSAEVFEILRLNNHNHLMAMNEKMDSIRKNRLMAMNEGMDLIRKSSKLFAEVFEIPRLNNHNHLMAMNEKMDSIRKSRLMAMNEGMDSIRKSSKPLTIEEVLGFFNN
jgi:hypothetical protein